ncbi:MAG TPA: hypothetical protein PLS29_09305 [Acidimicrobiales bacterium]|nr:MAG: hypothetical protein B7Z69_02810 [Actinobacteria bacterium 21-73-9]HQU27210.1 hypothetical protein [Acidimicrobiales bacterium]
MNPLELARTLAAPIQTIGAAFYFDPATRDRAHAIGLNVFEFYGLGRAGVMGDVEPARVLEVFAFFSPGAIEGIYSVPRARRAPLATARDYLEAAYAFAERTFGGVDPAALELVGAGARRVAEGARPGEAPLAEGYLAIADPVEPLHRGYLGAILLRELRGGVHLGAVRALGLAPSAASYLEGADVFALHGFGEDDVPEVTDALRASKVAAEGRTDERMAELLGVLDGSLDEFAVAVAAMRAALDDPVAGGR